MLFGVSGLLLLLLLLLYRNNLGNALGTARGHDTDQLLLHDAKGEHLMAVHGPAATEDDS